MIGQLFPVLVNYKLTVDFKQDDKFLAQIAVSDNAQTPVEAAPDAVLFIVLGSVGCFVILLAIVVAVIVKRRHSKSDEERNTLLGTMDEDLPVGKRKNS